jgi:anaerobic magnesium-protoporphyrin IX monomethyl ester cyclase
MKILLINPPKFNNNSMIREMRCAGLTLGSVYPPIELAYLAGNLRKNAQVKILDANALNYNFKEIEKKVNNFKPEAVIFTTSPTSFSYDAQIAKITKKINQKTKTILLDSHIVPVMPEKIKKSFPEIDHLVGTNPLLIIPKIFGFEGINELENHPLPAYDLLPIKKYFSLTYSRKKPFATIITSIGCPNSCNFCLIGGATVERGYGKMWQFKSAEKILNEIKYLLSLGIKSIYFFDETFTAQKKRVLDLCKMIEKEKLNFEWGCNGRVDTLDKETIKAMKKAGCWNIMFGIECGSEGLLEQANKGTTLTKALTIVNICKENNIMVSASFVIGFPNESWETVKQTLKIAKKINPYRAQFVILTPYPGTRFYQEVKNKKLLEKDYDFNGYDAYCVNQLPVLKTENLSSKELIQAQQYIYRKFYLRTSFILKTISSLKSFNQFSNLLKFLKYLK